MFGPRSILRLISNHSKVFPSYAIGISALNKSGAAAHAYQNAALHSDFPGKEIRNGEICNKSDFLDGTQRGRIDRSGGSKNAVCHRLISVSSLYIPLLNAADLHLELMACFAFRHRSLPCKWRATCRRPLITHRGASWAKEIIFIWSRECKTAQSAAEKNAQEESEKWTCFGIL